jgi:predicted glycosyltransferase
MSLVYLYSHDGDGLGHLRRNLNIAQMVTGGMPDTSCLLLTGSFVPAAFGVPARCDFVKIPTLEKRSPNGDYESPLQVPGSAALKLRQSMLESVVSRLPPDLLIVDKHPQGLGGELLPALRWLRRNSPRTRLTLGLRDVLDEPSRVEQEWRLNDTPRLIDEVYDHVWIYTDAAVHPTTEICDLAPALKEKGTATGYVVTRALGRPVAPGPGPRIVATVGGGRDGLPVLEATLRSVRRLRETFGSVRLKIFSGPLMPKEDHRRLRGQVDALGSWVKMERFSRRYLRAVRGATAVVTMGGYNSLLECVALNRPTVVVPREEPRREQLIRARIFERRGLVRVVRQSELDQGMLVDRLAEILEGRWEPATNSTLNLQGYRRILHDIGSMLKAASAEVSSCASLG